MTSARQIVIALVIAGTPCGVRAAESGGSGLELCIQTARDADTICAKADDPARRLQCFQTARTAQLDCLEHVLLPDAPTGATASSKPPEMPSSAQPSAAAPLVPAAPLGTPPQVTPAQGAPHESVQKDARTNTKEGPDGNSDAKPPKPTDSVAAPKAPATVVQATPEPAPPAPSVVAPAAPSAPTAVQADAPKNDTQKTDTQKTEAPKIEGPDIEAPKTDTAKIEPPKTEAPKTESPKTETAKTEAPKTEAPKAETPKAEAPKTEASKIDVPRTDAAKADAPKPDAPKPDAAKAASRPATAPPGSSWVVSETTSPVDYRPLLAAVTLPTSRSQDGPSRLAVRCLGGQTELSIRTEGTWRATRKNALPVDHQINDQSMVRQIWNLSVDAKTATYAGDAVELLRSFPDAARLTVNVPDATNVRHDATFVLTGWDTVRRRLEAACKWPKATDQASSIKR